MPDAEIIAIGSELLGAEKLDTNSLFLTARLNDLGVEVAQKCVVGDSRERLTSEIKAALGRSQVIILTGGLGPTEDDVTRDAAAGALGRPLVFSQEICDWLEERFKKFNRKMAEINKRQAYVIEGADVLPNDRGTAPGQWFKTASGAILMLLPGPPHEMKAMYTAQIQPRLEAMLPKQAIRTLFYRVAGMGESGKICVVLGSSSEGQIEVRSRSPASPRLVGVANGVRIRASGIAVQRHVLHVVTRVEDLLGAVAVVVVHVQHGDLGSGRRRNVMGSDRGIVEKAIAAIHGGRCMMAGGSAQPVRRGGTSEHHLRR